jgi:hypothetical protein
MKWIIVVALSFCSGLIYAASQDSDGNLVLTPDEVARTSAMFNQMNEQIYYSNMKIQELQRKLDYISQTKCL